MSIADGEAVCVDPDRTFRDEVVVGVYVEVITRLRLGVDGSLRVNGVMLLRLFVDMTDCSSRHRGVRANCKGERERWVSLHVTQARRLETTSAML